LSEYFIAAALMGGLGALLAAVLVIAYKKLYVYEAAESELRSLRLHRLPRVR
jgi:cell division protein FtsX